MEARSHSKPQSHSGDQARWGKAHPKLKAFGHKAASDNPKHGEQTVTTAKTTICE